MFVDDTSKVNPILMPSFATACCSVTVHLPMTGNRPQSRVKVMTWQERVRLNPKLRVDVSRSFRKTPPSSFYAHANL